MNRSLKEIALELLKRFEANGKALILETSHDADRDLHTLRYEVGLYLDAIEMASKKESQNGCE